MKLIGVLNKKLILKFKFLGLTPVIVLVKKLSNSKKQLAGTILLNTNDFADAFFKGFFCKFLKNKKSSAKSFDQFSIKKVNKKVSISFELEIETFNEKLFSEIFNFLIELKDLLKFI